MKVHFTGVNCDDKFFTERDTAVVVPALEETFEEAIARRHTGVVVADAKVGGVHRRKGSLRVRSLRTHPAAAPRVRQFLTKKRAWRLEIERYINRQQPFRLSY